MSTRFSPCWRRGRRRGRQASRARHRHAAFRDAVGAARPTARCGSCRSARRSRAATRSTPSATATRRSASPTARRSRSSPTTAVKIDSFKFAEDKPQEDSFFYSLVQGRPARGHRHGRQAQPRELPAEHRHGDGRHSRHHFQRRRLRQRARRANARGCDARRLRERHRRRSRGAQRPGRARPRRRPVRPDRARTSGRCSSRPIRACSSRRRRPSSAR